MYMNGTLLLITLRLVSNNNSFTATDTEGSDDYTDDVCSMNEEARCSITTSNHLVDPDVPLIEQE